MTLLGIIISNFFEHLNKAEISEGLFFGSVGLLCLVWFSMNALAYTQ